MKNFALIFLFFFGNQLMAQEDIGQAEENSIQNKLYGKCFEDLLPIAEMQQYISVSKIKCCSLIECKLLAEYFKGDKKMQSLIFKRAAEIAGFLYKEKHPVYLITGMDSYDRAKNQNLDINDDNGLIYISVGECVSSDALSRFKEAVNLETNRLLKNKPH